MGKIYVPVESFESYCDMHPEWSYVIRSRVYGIGEKNNYKKFARLLKKAVRHLPSGIIVEVKLEVSIDD